MEVLRGKYRIAREIARSNDIVYEATDVSLGRRVAIKELNLAAGLVGEEKRERIERFTREARATGRLTHPNIVSVYDYGEENGRYFLAMEFLQGQTLRDHMLARSGMPLREALDIIYQTLDALSYAHVNGVVHRDIKPDNLYVLTGGQIKLTDFGIARLSGENGLTKAGQVFGTPSYMSPEQIEGRAVDARSDIFSTGVMLYEMLAGRKPFVGDNVIAITYAIMNSPAAPLSNVPHAIETVIQRAISKSPLQRFSSAEEMKSELKRAEMAPATSSQMRSGRTSMTGQIPAAAYAQPMTPPPPLQQPSNQLPGGYALPQSVAPSPQPWAFNQGNPPQPIAATSGNLSAIPGRNPYASPPFQIRRPPSIQLSPGAKTLLTALVIAITLGIVVSVGAMMFINGYEKTKLDASTAEASKLINEGADSFKKDDYERAAHLFEDALKTDKQKKLSSTILTDLSTTYLRLGNKEAKSLNWKKAKEWCDKAVELNDPKTIDQARNSRATALENLGRREEAAQDREAAKNPSQTATPSLNNEPTLSPDEALGDSRAAGKRALDEGNQLARQGDVEGAKAKWLEAQRLAPGTATSEEARKNFEQNP